ncbi:hypothetical protein ACVW0Y_000920 [Pseudomonas sp. TE3786]
MSKADNQRSFPMLNQSLARLTELHRQLTPLLSADSPALAAHLHELARITEDLQHLKAVGSQLNHLSGAFELLVELPGTAHNRQLDGGRLQCLMEPLLRKLLDAQQLLDKVA